MSSVLNSETAGGSREFGDMRDYMAPSLFQPHRVRQAIRDAHEKRIPPLVGYYAGLTSVPINRFCAPMGFDCIWIDWEHTSCNVETMTTIVHETAFMSGGRTIPWVRVPGHDHASIGWALDAGASIVVPQVDTVEQARYVVSAAKFGNRQGGTRSVPPFRYVSGLTDGRIDAQKDIWHNLNDQAAIMIQIESLKGIDNLDEILTQLPDIDMVWLGSIDARVSMDLPTGWGLPAKEPRWVEAVEKFHATLKKHNKPYAGFAFGAGKDLPKMVAGMSMCLITSDTEHLMRMKVQLGEAKSMLAAAASEADA